MLLNKTNFYIFLFKNTFVQKISELAFTLTLFYPMYEKKSLQIQKNLSIMFYLVFIMIKKIIISKMHNRKYFDFVLLHVFQ